MLNRAIHTVRSMIRVAVLRSVWSNPLLRIACLLLLLIGTGWAATIIQVGVEETRRAIHFQHPSAHEARECHWQQKTAVLNIELEAQVEEILLAPGPLDSRFRYHCPHGGVYSFDDSGGLRCSKHGSAPGIRSVPFSPAGRNRP
jgi:hypothetical protein